MAASQANITLSAPGFGGLNTELAQTEQNEAFAARADNCVIDRFGRIGSRMGFLTLTTDNTAFNGEAVETVHEFYAEDGTRKVFSAAGDRLLDGFEIPVNVTPGGATITDDNWQIVNLDDVVYFVQEGHDVIHYTHSTTLTEVNTTSMPQGSCALAAYGRLWIADGQTVYWSQLTLGKQFSGGTGDLAAGSVNVQEFWPTGYDEIQGLAAHNGRLIIFGRDNIVVYAGAENPVSNLALEDTVPGIGCIARDTIATTGRDVYFLDETGVRSLARTIQEKSLPIGELSANVRTDLLTSISVEESTRSDARIRGCFSAKERMYLLILPETNLVYYFSTAVLDERGAARATKWPQVSCRFAFAGRRDLLFADENAEITKYSGYADRNESYTLRYFTNPLSFGDSTKLKMPKEIDLTLLTGSSGTVTVSWAFDYSQTFRTKIVQLAGAGETPEYGISEFGLAEYGGGVTLERQRAKSGGSGVVVQVGVTIDIGGEAFSLQELSIQALLGRQV